MVETEFNELFEFEFKQTMDFPSIERQTNGYLAFNKANNEPSINLVEGFQD